MILSHLNNIIYFRNLLTVDSIIEDFYIDNVYFDYSIEGFNNL